MRDNKPLRRELEYDLRFILPMHACIRKCVELLPFYTFQKFDQRVIQRAIDAMKPGLVIQRYVEHEVFHLHLPGNESLLQDLGLSVNKIFNL
jgi:hypothetical protein